MDHIEPDQFICVFEGGDILIPAANMTVLISLVGFLNELGDSLL